MDPSVWGPSFWTVLHYSSFLSSKSNFLELIDSMSYLLPCVHCRKSLNMYIRLEPPSAQNSDDLFIPKWTWKIHDNVNLKLNKPKIPFSILEKRRNLFQYAISIELLFSIIFTSVVCVCKSCTCSSTLERASTIGNVLYRCFQSAVSDISILKTKCEKNDYYGILQFYTDLYASFFDCKLTCDEVEKKYSSNLDRLSTTSPSTSSSSTTHNSNPPSRQVTRVIVRRRHGLR